MLDTRSTLINMKSILIRKLLHFVWKNPGMIWPGLFVIFFGIVIWQQWCTTKAEVQHSADKELPTSAGALLW